MSAASYGQEAARNVKREGERKKNGIKEIKFPAEKFAALKNVTSSVLAIFSFPRFSIE